MVQNQCLTTIFLDTLFTLISIINVFLLCLCTLSHTTDHNKATFLLWLSTYHHSSDRWHHLIPVRINATQPKDLVSPLSLSVFFCVTLFLLPFVIYPSLFLPLLLSLFFFKLLLFSHFFHLLLFNHTAFIFSYTSSSIILAVRFNLPRAFRLRFWDN